MSGTRTRLRGSTYADRKDYPWRISQRLHRRVTEAAERQQVTTTNLVLEALRQSFNDLPDAGRLADFEDVAEPTGRVTVSLRMDPSLYEKLQKIAANFDVSVNRYISFVAQSSTP